MYEYNVLYNDGSYMTYRFSDDDMEQITQAFRRKNSFAEVSSGILAITDIRSIVKRSAAEEQKSDPDVDPETREYLHAMREAFNEEDDEGGY